MSGELAAAYKSGSQSARVVTESWGASNFYCPNCTSPKLNWLKANTAVWDYECPSCSSPYQLKSQRAKIGNSITDGAYESMMKAISNDETPSFFVMQYDVTNWTVRNLLLIPKFAFPASAIIKRKPLALTARRAGWVGCNIDLTRIPTDARIAVVQQGSANPAAEVRAQFRRVKPLAQIKTAQRGWTLDVLNAVSRLDKKEFSTSEAYACERELEQSHPDNRHVKDKIRQQLQVLRDMGLLQHVERGVWRMA